MPKETLCQECGQALKRLEDAENRLAKLEAEQLQIRLSMPANDRPLRSDQVMRHAKEDPTTEFMVLNDPIFKGFGVSMTKGRLVTYQNYPTLPQLCNAGLKLALKPAF